MELCGRDLLIPSGLFYLPEPKAILRIVNCKLLAKYALSNYQ